MTNDLAKSPTEATPIYGRHFDPLALLRGVTGGIVGGSVGFVIFYWLAKNGLYGMMVPGALLGLGAGLAARRHSMALGVVCAVAAIGLAIFAEWKMFPFVKDNSFSFFVAHLHHLPPLKLIMMALGAVFAFWFGQGR